MRNAFLALLAVNLVYFAWAHWVDTPKPAPANEALAKLPRLKLVSELPPGQRPAQNTRTALNESAACLSVGPFGDIPNAARAASILSAKGFAPRQRGESAETSEGFWVYVGGMKTDVEADRVRTALARSGIKDALVMPAAAPVGRRVSLGLFSDRAHAEQRVAAVKRLGFKAEVAEHKLPGTVYWIDLAPRPGMTTVPIADLFAEGVGSRIAVEPCPVARAAMPVAATAGVTEAPATPPGATPPAASPASEAPQLAPAKTNVPPVQAAATPKLP